MIMGSHELKPALLALLLHFMISAAFNISQAQSASAPPRPERFPCNLVNCGHGTCDSAAFPFVPFDCVCDPGWKQITLGTLKLPPCLLPNCTVDFSCGGAAPLPPPPPPASLFPPLPAINFTDPCSYTNCGDGTCVRTGGSSGYRCDCNEGYANFLNSTALPCIALCSIGMDCNVSLAQLAPPPPTPNGAGRRQDRSFAADRHVLKVTILLAILCSWI